MPSGLGEEGVLVRAIIDARYSIAFPFRFRASLSLYVCLAYVIMEMWWLEWAGLNHTRFSLWCIQFLVRSLRMACVFSVATVAKLRSGTCRYMYVCYGRSGVPLVNISVVYRNQVLFHSCWYAHVKTDARQMHSIDMY